MLHWITCTGCLAFGLAALSAVVAAGRLRNRQWWWFACGWLLLSIELQWGLRHRLHSSMVEWLTQRHLYERRHGWQVLMLITIVIAVAFTSEWLHRRKAGNVPLLCHVAFLITLSLFAIETVSLHSIDAILYARVGGKAIIDYLWIGTATLFAMSALVATRKTR